MENKQSIMLVAVAVFCVVILLAQGNIEKVFALSFTAVATLSGSKCVDDGGSIYYFVTNCQGSNADIVTVERRRFSDNSLESSWQITGLHGNKTIGITKIFSGYSGAVGAIDCDSSSCWVTRTAASGVYQIQQWDTTGTPMGYLNYSSNSLEQTVLKLTGTETIGSVKGSGGGCGGSDWLGIAWIRDTSQVTNIATYKTFGTCSGSIVTMNPNPTAVAVSGNRIAYFASGASGGNNVIHIFNDVSLLRMCASSLSSTSTLNVNGISYLGSSVDKWAIPNASNNVLILNNNDTCTINTTVTSAELGSTNYIMALGVNTHNSQYMVYHTSTGTVAKVSVMSLTSLHNLTITITANGAGQIANFGMFATSDNILVRRNHVFLVDSTSTGRMWILDDTSGIPAEGGTTTDDFCDPIAHPENQDLLRCVLEHQGGALGGFENQTNPFDPIGGTNAIIVDALGLNNTNVKTNGVGYILLAIAIILFCSLTILALTFAAGKGYVIQVFDIIWILLVVTLAVEAAFIMMGITDVTFFIITVVALVALASPKIVSILHRGGGSSA